MLPTHSCSQQLAFVIGDIILLTLAIQDKSMLYSGLMILELLGSCAMNTAINSIVKALIIGLVTIAIIVLAREYLKDSIEWVGLTSALVMALTLALGENSLLYAVAAGISILYLFLRRTKRGDTTAPKYITVEVAFMFACFVGALIYPTM